MQKQVELIAETCNDGIKNQDEKGIDCGGVCKPCVESNTSSSIEQNDTQATPPITGFAIKNIGNISKSNLIVISIVFSLIVIFGVTFRIYKKKN